MITLTSGLEVEGLIKEKTEEFIIVNYENIDVKFYMDEVMKQIEVNQKRDFLRHQKSL